jgi:hypothetical protein
MKPLFTTTDISDKLTQTQNSPADLNAKIVAQMHAAVAHFFFTKKDGSVREAYGTLNKDILETYLGPQDEPTQTTEPIPDSTQVFQNYFDLTAEGEGKKKWRRYDIANLVALF